MKTKRSLSSTTFIALYLTTLAGFTSCSGQEDILSPKGKIPVGITASIEGEVATKATDSNYAPANGDKAIYLYYKNGANTTATEKGIFNYASSWTADGTASSGHQIFWDDLIAEGGKYPFFAVSPKDLNKATESAVQQDQSSNDNFANSDLLMAFNNTTTKQGKVSLNFKHMLAKLTVKVKIDAVTTFKSSAMSILNAKKTYTVNYTSPAPTTEVPATVAVKTADTPGNLTPYTEATENSNKTQVYSIILPAQQVSSSGVKIQTSITVGSSTTETNVYTYAPTSPLALTNGTHTILTLTINGTKVELDNVTVTNWTETSTSGNITIDTPGS